MNRGRSSWLLIGVGILLAGAGFPGSAWACECSYSSDPSQSFREASVVFRGTVTEFRYRRRPLGERLQDVWDRFAYGYGASPWRAEPYGPFRTEVLFEVKEAWKGVSDTDAIHSQMTAEAVTATQFRLFSTDDFCPYTLNRGGSYVVYADKYSDLSIRLCGRTREVARASADLAFLETMPTLPLPPDRRDYAMLLTVAVVLLITLAGVVRFFRQAVVRQ